MEALGCSDDQELLLARQLLYPTYCHKYDTRVKTDRRQARIVDAGRGRTTLSIHFGCMILGQDLRAAITSITSPNAGQ